MSIEKSKPGFGRYWIYVGLFGVLVFICKDGLTPIFSKGESDLSSAAQDSSSVQASAAQALPAQASIAAGATDAINDTRAAIGANANASSATTKTDVAARASGATPLLNPDGESAGGDTRAISELREFLNKRAKGEWRLYQNDEGALFRMVGGEIPNLGGNSTEVRKLVVSVADILGVPPEQISSEVKVKETTQFEVYDINQTHDGYPVYEGWTRVMVDKKTGAGLIYNNSLKNVSGNLASRRDIGARKVESAFAGGCDCEVKEFIKNRGPFVYPDGPKSELAYELLVETSNDTLRAVVSAETGAIIRMVSSRMY